MRRQDAVSQFSLDCGSDGFELPLFVRKRFRELPFFPAAKLADSHRRRKAEAHPNSLPQSKAPVGRMKHAGGFLGYNATGAGSLVRQRFAECYEFWSGPDAVELLLAIQLRFIRGDIEFLPQFK